MRSLHNRSLHKRLRARGFETKHVSENMSTPCSRCAQCNVYSQSVLYVLSVLAVCVNGGGSLSPRSFHKRRFSLLLHYGICRSSMNRAATGVTQYYVLRSPQHPAKCRCHSLAGLTHSLSSTTTKRPLGDHMNPYGSRIHPGAFGGLIPCSTHPRPYQQSWLDGLTVKAFN